MAGLFNPSTSTTAIPSFLRGPAPLPMAPADAKSAIQAVRQDAREARAALSKGAGRRAEAPKMAISTIGGYTTAYSMSNALRNLLDRLGSFLSSLLPPVQPPKNDPPKHDPPKSDPPTSNGATDFVLSSFNVLRTSAGKGKGFANSMQRMAWTVQVLESRKVSVVGFQEMDAAQLAEFKRLAGDEYGTFAGASGQKGYHDTALAWRKDTWDLVKADTITVPSYEGRASKVPYVRLKNKKTGQEAYFVDIHNPANTRNHHHQERFRNEAARQEAALVKRLMERSGLPVFLMGDFNSVEPAREIVTKGAPVVAANAQTGQRAGIDWIFGSKGIKFSKFSRTRDGLIHKTTDHPVLFSKVHIGQQWSKQA